MTQKKSSLSPQEYTALVAEVNRLRNQIHLFNNDEIGEEALDDLKHTITLFEQENPDLISPNSPNNIVAGGIAAGFAKAPHTRRMLSINDVFSLTELQEWERRWQDFLFSQLGEDGLAIAPGFNMGIPDTSLSITAQKDVFAQHQSPRYVCEPKIDGLSMSVQYERGIFVRAVTRGDGWIGEDITENVRHIESIPKHISDERSIEVRGEVFLTKRDFETLNKRITAGEIMGKMGKTGPEATFANPRNAAAGTLRNLDSSIVRERNLSFIGYGCFVG
jgi:DNA ligase (NAD+)